MKKLYKSQIAHLVLITLLSLVIVATPQAQVEETEIWGISSSGLFSMKDDGSDLSYRLTGFTNISDIAFDSSTTHTFFANRSPGAIYRLNVATHRTQFLYAPQDGLSNSLASIDYDQSSDIIYWAEDSPPRLLRAPGDGSGPIEILYETSDGLNAPGDIKISNSGFIYWTEPSQNRILRAPKDGTGSPELLFDQINDGINNLQGLALEEGVQDTLYWIVTNPFSTSQRQVFRGRGDGQFLPTVQFNLSRNLRELTWNPMNGDIYAFASGEIWHFNSATTVLTRIYDSGDGVGSPGSLDIDTTTGDLYWSQTNNDLIWKGGLNQVVPELLLTRNDGGFQSVGGADLRRRVRSPGVELDSRQQNLSCIPNRKI